MNGELFDLETLQAQLRCIDEYLKWPIKKEQGFEINTCYILDQYLRILSGMLQGENVTISFNQVAAVLDWATKIYNLKVDYIYEIAYNIYEFFHKHYEQAQHPSSEAEPTTSSRNEGPRHKRRKLDQIPSVKKFETVRVKWCRQKTRRPIQRTVNNLVSQQLHLDPPRPAEQGSQDNQLSKIKLIQNRIYRRLRVNFLSIDLEENNKSVKSLIKLRPVTHDEVVAATLKPENEVTPLNPSDLLPHSSDLLTHPPDSPLHPPDSPLHPPDSPLHPSDSPLHPSESPLAPPSPTADLSAALDEPPLSETPKAPVQPPQPMHRKKRKLFDDDDLEEVRSFDQSLKIQKRHLSQLAERTEFELPEEYCADKLAQKRCRTILQSRRDWLDFTADSDQGIQGFNESMNISDIACGFRGWCSTDVEEAESQLENVNTSIKSIDTTLEMSRVESVDDGFFEQSSVEDCCHSTDTPGASSTFTPNGLDLDMWAHEVAARSTAAEGAGGVDVRALSVRVLAAVPRTHAVPFPRLLATTATEPRDVSHLFLTTLFLANEGSVRIVRGTPLSLGDFSARQDAPARPLPLPARAAGAAAT